MDNNLQGIKRSKRDIRMNDILNKLDKVIKASKNANSEQSYVASLYKSGTDTILKKLGEEAIETVIAGKAGNRDEIIYEMADLWFHSLVLLAHNDIDLQDVLGELNRRLGMSGIEEKSRRNR